MTHEPLSKVLDKGKLYGGAESSVAMALRYINELEDLNYAQKRRLSENVLQVVDHTVQDAYTVINNSYDSAHSSGIKYLKFKSWGRPRPNLFGKYTEEDLKAVYATSTLQQMRKVMAVKKRVADHLDRVDAARAREKQDDEMRRVSLYSSWTLFGEFVTKNSTNPELQNSFIPLWTQGDWDGLDKEWPEFKEFVNSLLPRVKDRIIKEYKELIQS